jgi:hypothetical protein
MKITIAKVIFLALTLILIPSATGAQTPDGQTPAVKTYCDEYSGRKFGICNAWYEAMDCDDPAHKASACDNLKAMLDDLGVDTSPSSGTATPCPCFGDLTEEEFTQNTDCSLVDTGLIKDTSNGRVLTVQAIASASFNACIGVDGQLQTNISLDEATTCVSLIEGFCAGLP